MSNVLTSLRHIDDHARFTALPTREQQTILNRIGWVNDVVQAAHGTKGAVVARAAEALGVNEVSIHRWVAKFRNEGWTGLMDKRSKTSTQRGTPQAFRDWVAGLHLAAQRDTTGREVYRQVMERWSAWRRSGDPLLAIPGYDTPPKAERTGYPRGWSEDQILRMRPESYARTAARQGEKLAAKFLPSIRKTRVGLGFGEVVFFDDQDYDLKVVAPGFSQKTMRPLGFNSIDYLSGCFLDSHIRMRFWDVDEQKHKSLTGIEATWFVLNHLLKHGYRTDSHGTTLVVEHGTMNTFANKTLLTPNGHHRFEDAIAAITGEHVRIDRSGLYNTPIFAEMLFRPQSSGNPNFKSPIESMFNPLRNRMASLAGNIGLNRDHTPAEQYGLTKSDEELLKMHDRLPEHVRHLIRYTNLTSVQFAQVAAACYEALNCRTDHRLEGWSKCGFEVPLFRWSEDTPWISQDELADQIDRAPHLRQVANELMTRPGHTKPHRLAPANVRDMCQGELTQLQPHMVPLVLPTSWAKDCRVKSDRTIAIKDQFLGDEPFEYIARWADKDGAWNPTTGTTLKVYLNPLDPSTIYVCRSDGSWQGCLHEVTRANYHDHEAIELQLRERAKLKADLDTTLRPALSGIAAQRQSDKEHNDNLRAEHLPGPDAPSRKKRPKRDAAAIVQERAQQAETDPEEDDGDFY